MCRVESQKKNANEKNDKMKEKIDEMRRREANQWALSLDDRLYWCARMRKITTSYAVIDLCLNLPETPAVYNAGYITKYHTVIFALENNVDLAFTVGTRE